MGNTYARDLPVDRIAKKLTKRGDCLVWTGTTNVGTGEGIPYGLIKVAGKMKLVHRLTWEATNGPIKDGMEIGRHCRNSLCCNIAHMFLFPRIASRRRA